MFLRRQFEFIWIILKIMCLENMVCNGLGVCRIVRFWVKGNSDEYK